MFYRLGVTARDLMVEYGIGKARLYEVLKAEDRRSARRLRAQHSRRIRST